MTDRDELLAIVRYIMNVPEDADEGALSDRLERFIEAIPHPGGSDLLYYPQHWGLPLDLSAEGVVEAALSWVPRALVMEVAAVRAHPSDDGLRCYQVVVPGSLRTQIVAAPGFSDGDAVVVALAGCRLLDGSSVRHSFVGHAFSAGLLLEGSELPPDSDVTATYCSQIRA